MSLGVRVAEAGRLPDFLLRAVIRLRHREVLRREDPGRADSRQEALRGILQAMETVPVAPAPLEANLQHYEVPPTLFQEMLGPWLKYSACLWPEEELGRRPRPSRGEAERQKLGRAEEAMLALTAGRADIHDGMRILDLGCGWGSFSLWAAERFPEARLVAVSNSRDQGEFIRSRARERGLDNIEAITADMNDFQPPPESGPFDRIVSVEMFEHLGNWPELLRRINGWLAEGGRFFMHIFAHRAIAYSFQDGPRDWMARHFFAGGIMPADSLPLHLQRDLVLLDHWIISGLHYARTLDSWLALLDSSRRSAMGILSEAYGAEQAAVRLNRWRLFLMACSELFAYNRGNEWFVSHYLFSRRPPP